jgi:hypothetical protein
VVPEALDRLMGDKDRDKANRVLQAMLRIKKIDIRARESIGSAESLTSALLLLPRGAIRFLLQLILMLLHPYQPPQQSRRPQQWRNTHNRR